MPMYTLPLALHSILYTIYVVSITKQVKIGASLYQTILPMVKTQVESHVSLLTFNPVSACVIKSFHC